MLPEVLFWLGMVLAIVGWVLAEAVDRRKKMLRVIGFVLMILAVTLFILSGR
ncbi:MAG: hypothetical protein ACYC0Q_02970 [Eubacteriales bacterium]